LSRVFIQVVLPLGFEQRRNLINELLFILKGLIIYYKASGPYLQYTLGVRTLSPW